MVALVLAVLVIRAWCHGCCRAVGVVGVFVIAQDAAGVLGAGVDGELCVAQVACGTCAESIALDIFGDAPVLDAVGSLLVDDADGEDGEVVYLHGDVLEHQLLDASHHVGEHSGDGTWREWRVVFRHVLGEFGDADGLRYYWASVILAESFLDGGVHVLHQFNQNHSVNLLVL